MIFCDCFGRTKKLFLGAFMCSGGSLFKYSNSGIEKCDLVRCLVLVSFTYDCASVKCGNRLI